MKNTEQGQKNSESMDLKLSVDRKLEFEKMLKRLSEANIEPVLIPIKPLSKDPDVKPSKRTSIKS